MTESRGFDAGRAGGGKSALLVVAACAMLVAVYLGLSIGQGEWKKAYLLMLGLGAFPLMLMLGSSYWVVLPFAMTVSLPAIPLVPGRMVSLGELAAVAAVAALVLRLPLAGTKIRWFRREYVPILLFVLWAAFIYKVNGAGLAIFGASTVGARSYMKIGLAFAVFFVICNQRIEERHCRIIVYSLLGAAVLSTGWNIYRFFNPETGVNLQAGEFYAWHQNLGLLPLFFLSFAFAKNSLQELLRGFRVDWLGAILICYGLAAFSGKRAVFAACLLLPILSLALRRQYLTLFMSLFAVAGILTSMVVGHGRVFELPLTVQRVLWILPGDWDAEVRMSTLGSFRQTLNKLAMRQIAEAPIVGRGFGFTPLDADLASNPQALRQMSERGDHVGAFLMAVGGRWHSTWLGISAALGIPGAVFWGLIWLQVIGISWWLVKRAPPGSYSAVLAAMIFMLTVVDICRSMTSGHAADNLWTVCWRLGVLVLLKWGIQEQEATALDRARSLKVAPEGTRPRGLRIVPVAARGEALARKSR